MWGISLLDPQDRLLHGVRNSFPLSDRLPASSILSGYLRALWLKMQPRTVSKQSRWSHKCQDFTSTRFQTFFAGINFTFAPYFGLLWSFSTESLFSLARPPFFHDVTISPSVSEIPANRKWRACYPDQSAFALWLENWVSAMRRGLRPLLHPLSTVSVYTVMIVWGWKWYKVHVLRTLLDVRVWYVDKRSEAAGIHQFTTPYVTSCCYVPCWSHYHFSASRSFLTKRHRIFCYQTNEC
jgi:hypothetical protein